MTDQNSENTPSTGWQRHRCERVMPHPFSQGSHVGDRYVCEGEAKFGPCGKMWVIVSTGMMRREWQEVE